MHGFFFDNKRIFMILEYASEGELYNVLKKVQRFPEATVAKYIKQMIAAVKHIHSLNIIHRDIKPENILLCEGDQLKLSDFGWAAHTTQTRKTFCGTADYICPEIIKSEAYDNTVDIWCLGILTYELCCGSPPFEPECFGTSKKQETMRRIRRLEYTFPSYFSKELKHFI